MLSGHRRESRSVFGSFQPAPAAAPSAVDSHPVRQAATRPRLAALPSPATTDADTLIPAVASRLADRLPVDAEGRDEYQVRRGEVGRRNLITGGGGEPEKLSDRPQRYSGQPAAE